MTTATATATDQIDKTLPARGSQWAFDADVTKVFDNMLERSIPGYHQMRELSLRLGDRFLQKDTDMLDIGSSRGAGLRPFVDRYWPHIRFVGIDESLPMIEAAREEFQKDVDAGRRVEFRHDDVTHRIHSDLRPSLTLCVLTAMFIPLEDRQRLIRGIYEATVPGGAMVFVEKTLAADAEAELRFVSCYTDLKRAAGYTVEQINAKRMSLRRVLMPLTAEANVAMLQAEGFKVQEFWRALSFVGWICVKPRAE